LLPTCNLPQDDKTKQQNKTKQDKTRQKSQQTLLQWRNAWKPEGLPEKSFM
jgi:hypothetical protein